MLKSLGKSENVHPLPCQIPACSSNLDADSIIIGYPYTQPGIQPLLLFAYMKTMCFGVIFY